MICTNLQNMAAFVRAAALGWCGVHVFTTYVGSIVVVSKSQGSSQGEEQSGEKDGEAQACMCTNVTTSQLFVMPSSSTPPTFFDPLRCAGNTKGKGPSMVPTLRPSGDLVLTEAVTPRLGKLQWFVAFNSSSK